MFVPSGSHVRFGSDRPYRDPRLEGTASRRGASLAGSPLARPWRDHYRKHSRPDMGTDHRADLGHVDGSAAFDPGA